MRLDGRTVIVTGGASGLGGATVDMVVAAGGRAVIVDINDAGRRGEGAPGTATSARFVKTDVTSDTEMQRAVDARRQDVRRHCMAWSCAAGIAVAERVLPKEGVQPLAHFTRTITDQPDRHVQRDSPCGGGDGGATSRTRQASAA